MQNEHVQAQGRGHFGWTWCPSEITITLDKAVGTWLATAILVFPESCSEIISYVSSSPFGNFAFAMEGDWERGFEGSTGYAALTIGPYGDGTSIEVLLCTLCFSGTRSDFVGTVSDLRLD